MSWREKAKEKAALEAAKLIKDGYVIGLGSGSTAAYAIQRIGGRIRREGILVLGVPTSHQALTLGVESGIPLTTLDEHPQLDLAIDGADQVDGDLNLIKGGGGALMREKVIASAAKRLVIVTDETKLVERLGTKHPVFVEVLPFALPSVSLKIQALGGKPVLRKSESIVSPVITDNGNFILDVDFGPLEEPRELDVRLKLIPGVMETGLFIGMTDVVYVGGPAAVRKLTRKH